MMVDEVRKKAATVRQSLFLYVQYGKSKWRR